MNKWTKSLLHRWMFIKQDGGPTDPMYFRCVRCGVWKLAAHYQLGSQRETRANLYRGVKRYSANYSAGLVGPWVHTTQELVCEGFDSPSLFPKWFYDVPYSSQETLRKKGKL